MADIIKFRIDGKPQAKQSVKFAKIQCNDGREFIHKYTPVDMVNYANWVKQCFRQNYPEHLPSAFYNKPLVCRITVNYEIPKSVSDKKRVQMLNGLIIPTIKPDCDNISKNICDALNGIAYPDDKQIAKLIVKKVYNTEPYTIVEIASLTTQTQEQKAEQTKLFNK